MPTTAAQDLLIDAFGRVRDLVQELTDGLDVELASWRVDAEANSISWLLWHLTRIQDDHLADLAGVEQAWEAWRNRFGLPFEAGATGYGQTTDQVGRLQIGGELLAGYHADVHAITARYLEQVDDNELARVIDRSFDPPVTVSARLVSVLGDTLQHLGQAGYIRGLAERR